MNAEHQQSEKTSGERKEWQTVSSVWTSHDVWIPRDLGESAEERSTKWIYGSSKLCQDDWRRACQEFQLVHQMRTKHEKKTERTVKPGMPPKPLHRGAG